MALAFPNQNGNYAGGRGLYPLPSACDSRPKPAVRAKIYENVTALERWQQVQYAMILSSRVPGIDAALDTKSDYVVGDAWYVDHRSKDKAWGKLCEELINEGYYRHCNRIAPAWNWQASLKTLCRTLDVQGDYGIWFDGVDEPGRKATGQFQLMDYSRFGTGLGIAVKADKTLKQCNELGNWALGFQAWGYSGGWGTFLPWFIIYDRESPYYGYRIMDGIIVDANLTTVAYRVLGYNDVGMATYSDVPASMIHFNYEPGKWISQVRGITPMACMLEDINRVSDILYYWGVGVQIASQKMVVRESIDGRPGSNVQETLIDTCVPGQVQTGEGCPPPVPSPIQQRRMVAIQHAGPGVTELSSKDGEKLSVLDNDRPSVDERALVEILETGFFHRLWPRGLIYTETTSRAPARIIVQQTQMLVQGRQKSIERSARWIIDRRIALAISRGELPPNNNLGDAYNYTLSLPGKLTCDEGNDGKMYLSLLGRGCISRGVICSDMGVQEHKILDANEESVDNLMTRAENLKKKHNWATEMECLNRLDNNGNANQPAMQEPDAAKPGEPAVKPKAKPAIDKKP